MSQLTPKAAYDAAVARQQALHTYHNDCKEKEHAAFDAWRAAGAVTTAAWDAYLGAAPLPPTAGEVEEQRLSLQYVGKA